MFAEGQNFDLFSSCIFERPSCYGTLPELWVKYEAASLIFVPAPFALSYYSRLDSQGLADNQTLNLTMALMEDVVMAVVMFVLNAWDRACPSCYTYKTRFDHMESSFLFKLPSKLFDYLKYFGSYKFFSLMETDPVLRAPVYHPCSEVDWDKLVVREGFMSYKFLCGKVYNFGEKSEQEI